MDDDRIEGKRKQIEGEAQVAWGKLKDRARDLRDDVGDVLDRDEDEKEKEREKDEAHAR
jgi:uncharacterized protein YjbJ (UPF0337 family)